MSSVTNLTPQLHRNRFIKDSVEYNTININNVYYTLQVTVAYNLRVIIVESERERMLKITR